MKKIKLISLELNNFKGTKHLELEPNGDDLEIYGQNETGKTTIVDAWSWLLFHKDSKGNSTQKFDIKPLQKNGEAVHQIETSVKATLQINDNQLTLEKIYSEVWQKKRGSNNKQFQGHTTNYFLSGAKVKKKEYEERIKEIVDEDIFRLITDPLHFNNLHWKERREVLTNLQNVTDEEVITEDEKLEQLADALEKHDVEKHKESLKRKMNDLNDEIEKIPIRIDEVNESLPDIQKLDKNEIKKNIEKLKKNKKSKEKEISRIENGGEIAQKEKELAEIETELQNIKNDYTAEYDEKIEEAKEELYSIRDKIGEINTKKSEKENSIKSNNSDIKRIENNKNTLKDDWYDKQQEKEKWLEKEFNEDQFEKVICPDCGTEFPIEDLESHKKEFNQKKADKIEKLNKDQEEINKEGKKCNKEIKKLNQKNDELKKYIKELEDQEKYFEEKKSDLQAEINNLQQKKNRVFESDTYKEILKDKEQLQQQIKELKNNDNKEVGRLEVELQGIERDIEQEKEKLSSIKQYNKSQKRIEELKAKEKELAQKYEELEREYYLCEEFEKQRAGLLEDKVNDLFDMAGFKLFEEQINGGIKPTCRTLYQGVPFNTGLNDGNRVKVGLDIIKTLSNYYEVQAPIFIDNMESVTGEVKADSQLIKLIVSPQDEELRIEDSNKNIKEAV